MSWVSETGEPSRWHCPHSRGTSMVEVGERGSERAQDVVRPVAQLAGWRGAVAALGGRAVQALVVLRLLVRVAASAVHGRQLLGVGKFLLAGQVRVAVGALQRRVGRAPQRPRRRTAGGTPGSRLPVRRPLSWHPAHILRARQGTSAAARRHKSRRRKYPAEPHPGAGESPSAADTMGPQLSNLPRLGPLSSPRPPAAPCPRK